MNRFDVSWNPVYCEIEVPLGTLSVFWLPMGNFGEDLRMERLSRGIALEQITAVTKISQRHLIALEQGSFCLLPGGILNKGIVRGYAAALGLDQQAWTERFLEAYVASGQMPDDDRNWTAFAANVGRARIQRRDAIEARLRWAGAILLLLLLAAGTYLTVRYVGLHAGWWSTFLPTLRKSAVTWTALLLPPAPLVQAVKFFGCRFL